MGFEVMCTGAATVSPERVGPSAGGDFLHAPEGVGRREATAQGIRVMRERFMSFLANRSRAAHLRVPVSVLIGQPPSWEDPKWAREERREPATRPWESSVPLDLPVQTSQISSLHQ